MPGLDLVKRIAASDKRTSFVGSDFLYEDVSGRSLEEDTHELIETTDVFYVVKNTPKSGDGVEFGYYNVSIDKKTSMPMKMDYYDKSGKLYRTIESVEVKEIWPPCWCTIRFVVRSPSPVPRSEPLVVKNLENTFLLIS